MTNKEAVKYAKENILAYTSEMAEFKVLAIEALKKQIPKKPARRTIYAEHWQGYYTIRVCPVCGVDTPVPRELESWEFWCPDCGQALDWSEESEERGE